MASRPSRKSIRLKEYDYSGSGGYFVTICIQNRSCLLGEIELPSDTGGHVGPPLREGECEDVNLFPAGKMVERWWNKIPEKFPGIGTDAFVVMPNHVHFILINKIGLAVGADPRVCPDPATGGAAELGTIIQWFKTMTTNEYIRGVKEQGWPRFNGKLWQRNYWERILRENEWDRARLYIHNNPINWAADKLNPNEKPL